MIARTYGFSTETKLNKIFSGSHNFEAAERLKQELKRAEAPPTLVQFLLRSVFSFFAKTGTIQLQIHNVWGVGG